MFNPISFLKDLLSKPFSVESKLATLEAQFDDAWNKALAAVYDAEHHVAEHTAQSSATISHLRELIAKETLRAGAAVARLNALQSSAFKFYHMMRFDEDTWKPKSPDQSNQSGQ